MAGQWKFTRALKLEAVKLARDRTRGHLRLHRTLLQSHQEALDPRQQESAHLRTSGSSLTHCPLNPVQATDKSRAVALNFVSNTT